MRVWSFGWLLVVALIRVSASDQTGQVPFRLFRDGAVVVPVSIDGGQSRPFLLDTGASRSAVANEVAIRLRLPGAGTAFMAGVAGTQPTSLVRLNRLALGDGAPVDLTALVVPEGRLDARAPVDGLIGQDLLAARAFTLDYHRRTLTWLDAGAVAQVRGTRVPLSIAGGRAVITLAAPGGGSDGGHLRLIPDSGADALVLFAGGGRARLEATPLDAVRLRTVAGDRLVRRVLLDRLEVGDVALRDLTSLVIEGTPDAVDADGLLPLHLFSRVTVDGPGGALIVER